MTPDAPVKWHKVTPDEIIADLRRVQGELGYVSQAAYEAYGRHAKATVVRAFASWREACRVAGVVTRTNGARIVRRLPETVSRLCMDCLKPFPKRVADPSHRRCDDCRYQITLLASIPEGCEYFV